MASLRDEVTAKLGTMTRMINSRALNDHDQTTEHNIVARKLTVKIELVEAKRKEPQARRAQAKPRQSCELL